MACVSAAGVAREQRLDVLPRASRRTPRSQIRPYLMTSARPGAQLALGQRCERVGVGEHRAGLVERADQVLAAAGG